MKEVNIKTSVMPIDNSTEGFLVCYVKYIVIVCWLNAA
jgi:hypothetical protein